MAVTDVLLRAARNIGALILTAALLAQIARRLGGHR